MKRSPRPPRAGPGRLAAVASCLALAVAAPRPAAAQAGDEGAETRGRFEEGLAHFRANDMAKAVAVWAPIVEQLGDERAYRLLFNLGVAHEALGDATGAADHYERFLARVEARSARGQKVPPDVLAFRDEARGRLGSLQARYGRVRVANDRDGLLVAARVGGASGPSGRTYYVAPGAHEVVLRAGAAAGEERRAIEVRAGQLVEVAPRPLPGAPPRVLVLPPPPPPPPDVPPYSPWVVAAAGGVTLASGLVPLAFRNAAVSVAERYYDPATPVGERARVASDYDAARSRYAWSWALPGALAAGTGALAVYYFAGAKPRRPALGVRLGGGPAGPLGLSVAGPLGE